MGKQNQPALFPGFPNRVFKYQEIQVTSIKLDEDAGILQIFGHLNR